MPDSKITALTSISTSTDPANDPLVIVDVSDTSMAATGTTKKVTLNQLLGASGTATLASATITGDLTVDTSTLKVDSANNRVGIGTATPGCNLEVYSSSANELRVSTITAGDVRLGMSVIGTTYNWIDSLRSGGAMVFGVGNAEHYRITSGGTFTWSDGGGGTRMTLNSTGLGVGVVPSAARLEVGGQDGTQFYIRSTGTTPSKIRGFTNAAEAGVIGFLNGGGIYFDISGERMRIDSSGNVGVGVTPTNYGATFRTLAVNATDAGILDLMSNSVSQFRIFGNGLENRLGGITNVPMTFHTNNTERARIDASGNLLVGTTTAAAKITALAGASGQAAIFQQPAQNFWCVLAHNQATSGDNSFVLFGTEASFTSRGSITYNRAAGLVAYNITSDYRLKEDVKPLTGALNRISSLKPSTYKFKETGFICEGFIAHELAEVIPAAVTGEKDAVNEDGSIKAQGVDLSKVVPVLVAAIQELAAEVNALKNA